MITSALKTLAVAGLGMTLTSPPPPAVERHPMAVARPAEPASGYFRLGAAKNPEGVEISINSRHLLLGGQPWFPVIGEFHFSRHPRAEWAESLRKMRLGGIRIVSTYVFWNHHEEVEGEWDWSGQRDLRAFLEACRNEGLLAIVRCGPWCNGEARYGGFPDWIEKSPHWPRPPQWGMRPADPRFFQAVERLYSQIGSHMQGLLWKDGGPVVGIQLDNEYSGPSRYLLDLKSLALRSGMDVPLYTKTGWPRMIDPLPAGEIIPFYGAYAEAAWEGTTAPLDSMGYNYEFRAQRIDESIASDVNPVAGGEDAESRARYPFLTAETGSGMFVSYHRRNRLDPRDIVALALCQIGSGCAGIGYYMYHGGENPEGRLAPLHKSTTLGDVFDITEKSYDFQAPVGTFGQLRPHYHGLRRLNLFLEDFGPDLARMPATLPPPRPDDSGRAPLRWSVRSDGEAGFLFVNNYERLRPMPARHHVQFDLDLPGNRRLSIPAGPVTIPADASFIWPFRLPLNGITLAYATAQPLMKRSDPDGGWTVFFAETAGVPAEFAFDTATLEGFHGFDPLLVVRADCYPQAPLRLRSRDGRELRVVLLNEGDSLALARDPATGQPFLEAPAQTRTLAVESEPLKPAGPLRNWSSPDPSFPLPVAPGAADFAAAAVWKIQLPPGLDLAANPILRIHYSGDVARLTHRGRLLSDDFHNGSVFEIGLRRHGPDILTGDLHLEILPLQESMPVYFEKGSRPAFGPGGTALALHRVELVQPEKSTPALAFSPPRPEP